MKIGEWIIYNEYNGIQGFIPVGCHITIEDKDTIFEKEVYSFSTKKEAIQRVHSSVMRLNERPKVKRLDRGKYVYGFRSVDTGQYRYEYFITQLTKENIDDYLNEFKAIQETSDNG